MEDSSLNNKLKKEKGRRRGQRKQTLNFDEERKPWIGGLYGRESKYLRKKLNSSFSFFM